MWRAASVHVAKTNAQNYYAMHGCRQKQRHAESVGRCDRDHLGRGVNVQALQQPGFCMGTLNVRRGRPGFARVPVGHMRWGNMLAARSDLSAASKTGTASVVTQVREIRRCV